MHSAHQIDYFDYDTPQIRNYVSTLLVPQLGSHVTSNTIYCAGTCSLVLRVDFKKSCWFDIKDIFLLYLKAVKHYTFRMTHKKTTGFTRGWTLGTYAVLGVASFLVAFVFLGAAAFLGFVAFGFLGAATFLGLVALGFLAVWKIDRWVCDKIIISNSSSRLRNDK